MDPVIDMEQNENEGEGLLPTLGHFGTGDEPIGAGNRPVIT